MVEKKVKTEKKTIEENTLDLDKIVKGFQKAIDVQFKNEDLALNVLLHPSLVGNPSAVQRAMGRKIKKHETYERLEFLGDRVLSLSIAEWLFETYPHEYEGNIAKRHTMLVKNETIAKISERLGVGAFVQLSTVDGLCPAGCSNKSINADVCEALLGAIFLDQGFEKARAFVRRMWLPIFEKYDQPQTDVKTKLQQWAQEHNVILPVYKMVKKEGPDHCPSFTVKAEMKGMEPVLGVASSKKEAEKKAAAIYVKKLNIK